MHPPIKLSGNKNLLKFINETNVIDESDYIESRIKTNACARALMAIEDASEIAKRFMFEKGVFEQILNSIGPISCVLKKNSKYVHASSNEAGHYVAASIDHPVKCISICDSMGSRSTCKPIFAKMFKQVFPNYKVNWSLSKREAPQPTGGFLDPTVAKSCGIRKQTNLVEEAFTVSQYDELSQHHFCYVESLVFFAHMHLKTPEGPKNPRDRLIFIKRVTWGLIHMFCKVDKRTTQWRYFEENFRWYLKITDSKGLNIPLKNHLYYMPNKIGFICKPVKVIHGSPEFKSIVQVIRWAGES